MGTYAFVLMSAINFLSGEFKLTLISIMNYELLIMNYIGDTSLSDRLTETARYEL
ncbi:hypothetical protein [Tolypothrix sp. VBCCA 56010]|uniref:hypothetical protein n=1 Tax=Tolypothrix sp. VBCCA 56010 TaxID=3137731 RepID=UPI003D7E5AAF